MNRTTPTASSLPLSHALRIARIPLGLAAILYLGATAYMGLYQRSFLYKPAPDWISPESEGIPRGERYTLTTTDGTSLAGWWIPPARENAPVFVYFHGNANGLPRRTGRFKLMTADGSGLLAMSYRGYGGSGGTPSEAALHADAETIYADLAKKILPERIVIFGESLGSGVALNLARKVKTKAIILDSPFLSVLKRAQSEYPWLPVPLILKDTFRSDLWIAEAKAPILIVHGTADTLIPLSDSETLATLGKPGNVTRKTYPGEPHVVPYDKGPGVDIAAFIGKANGL